MKKNIFLKLILSLVLFSNNFAMQSKITPTEYFKQLSDDILLKIFNEADLSIEDIFKMSSVNKRFNTILHQFYPVLDFSKLNPKQKRNLNKKNILKLVEKFRNIKEINIVNFENINPDFLQIFAENFNLKSINLSYIPNLKIKKIKNLNQYLINLTNINLVNCENLTDSDFSNLIQNCPNLENISINKGSILTDIFINNLAIKCPNLTNIDFCLCNKLINPNFNNFQNLKNINLSWCHHLINPTFDNNTSLLTVDLSWCSNLTNPTFNNCTNLEYIDLSHCEILSPIALINLIQNCPNLKFLNLELCENITDLELAYIKDNCHKLEYLSLFRCTKLTDQAIQNLKSVLPKCKIIKPDETII